MDELKQVLPLKETLNEKLSPRYISSLSTAQVIKLLVDDDVVGDVDDVVVDSEDVVVVDADDVVVDSEDIVVVDAEDVVVLAEEVLADPEDVGVLVEDVTVDVDDVVVAEEPGFVDADDFAVPLLLLEVSSSSSSVSEPVSELFSSQTPS